jgi:hypothetical protein
MKKYILALAAIILLTSCGVSETPVESTTPTTTPATFETTTASETTTEAPIIETTTIQTTTVSETILPVTYNDDEETLKNLIVEKADKELLFWEYGDFDKDGAFEAFAFTGEIKEYVGTNGSFFLVNSNGLNEIEREIFGVEVSTVTFDDHTFAVMVYHSMNGLCRILGVDGEEIYEPPISFVGQDFTITENGDITLIHSLYDAFIMGDSTYGAHTWKPYYFYYDNGFHEYGGSQIPLEELLTYENADTYVEEIKKLNGSIQNILKRENGIININYQVPEPDVDYLKWNYYYTLKLSDDGKVTHITDNPDNPEWDSGVYLPALVPEISVYSGVLYPVYQDGSYDYIDKIGKVVIDGNFDTAEFFSEGLGVVSKDEKYGAVNVNGDIVIPLEYSILGDFHCGLAYASYSETEEPMYGYIDINNDVAIEFNIMSRHNGYDMRDFSEDRVIIPADHGVYLYYCLDKSGQRLFEIDYVRHNSYIGDYKEGLLRVYQVFYDKQGELVLDDLQRVDGQKTGHYPWDFSEGLATYGFVYDDFLSEFDNFSYLDDIWYTTYVNKNGEIVFTHKFTSAASFSENLAVVNLDGKMGVININGEFVFFNDNLSFNEYYYNGLIAYRDKELSKFGFLDMQGNITIPPQFDKVYIGFVEDLALVEKDAKLAYINKQGEIIYEFDKPDEVNWKWENVL